MRLHPMALYGILIVIAGLAAVALAIIIESVPLLCLTIIIIWCGFCAIVLCGVITRRHHESLRPSSEK